MQEVSIIRTEVYNAPVDKVWKALTDKEQMKQWYFDISDFELKEGNTFNFYESDKKEYHHRAVIKKIIPYKKIQHTWTHPSHSKGESMLTWELFPEGNTTRVKLTHEGLENFIDGGEAFAAENYVAGWKDIMDKSLRNFLEETA